MLTINIDGAARGNPGPAGIGAIAKKNDKIIFQISEFIGNTTNNCAEYLALIKTLKKCISLKEQKVHIISDSELVVKQIKGEYKVKDEKLKPLFLESKKLIEKIKVFEITHTYREKNKEADKLANNAIDKEVLK